MSGQVIMEVDYTPFGEEIDIQALSNPDWQRDDIDHFTGHDPIDGFGLINMQARLYDPVTGRFLSPDTLVPRPDNILSYNRYVYVHNNPVNYIDPDGHFLTLLNAAIHVTIFTLPYTSDSRDAQRIGEAAQIAARIALAVATYGKSEALQIGVQMAAGATTNFVATGGDFGAAAEGAVIGGVSTAITLGIGQAFGGVAKGFAGFSDPNFYFALAANTLTQGVISELRGGQFRDGAVGAVFSKIGGQAGSQFLNNIALESAIVAGFSYLGAKALGSDSDDAVMQAVQAGITVYLYNQKSGGKGEKEGGFGERFKKITGMSVEDSISLYKSQTGEVLTIDQVEKMFTDPLYAKEMLLASENLHKIYRDILNSNAPQSVAEAEARGFFRLPVYKSVFHNPWYNPWRNSKWVGPLGHMEVVFSGKGSVVSDIKYMGTFNFFGPDQVSAHWGADVEPYQKWGN